MASARDRHRGDLTEIARRFDNIWTRYIDAGASSKEPYYIIDVEYAEYETFALQNGYMAQQLLSHLKMEFPIEFE
ncbi:hypothetical protein ACFLUU_03055 [Chloroflexota bacterium]